MEKRTSLHGIGERPFPQVLPTARRPRRTRWLTSTSSSWDAATRGEDGQIQVRNQAIPGQRRE